MNPPASKVLICDDEEGIRESLKLILEEHYELIVTEDSHQCLDCLKHGENIGVVLLDIKMPNRNGLDTLKEIKEKHPKQKVVIVTGYQSVELLAEMQKLGADGYITKPFDSKEILRVVKKQANNQD
ncbi:MAG: response regulator [Candidatus Omnitrophica bacterium]|nr:response regulator [Candidatus Omnitrophota bacterium]